MVVTFGKCLFQSFDDVLQGHDGSDFQQSAKYDHVECFRVIHFIRRVHGIDAVDVDILSRRRVDDAVTVVDKNAARLYLTLEFLQ